ncbi:MAG: hypothetical protein AB7U05_01860 [Mangrovibacterium sp.]
MKSIEVYHTQEKREEMLFFPILAEGNEQWLGDGFYFWQDYEFARWWGEIKKCTKVGNQFSIYKATLEFEEDDFIDTVFNEHDYYNFVSVIEKFAIKYQETFGKKASLEDFNDFISDHKIWENIKIIRFQDVPENSNLVEVKGFYYKKRIQIRVNEPEIIVNFAHFKNFLCS